MFQRRLYLSKQVLFAVSRFTLAPLSSSASGSQIVMKTRELLCTQWIHSVCLLGPRLGQKQNASSSGGGGGWGEKSPVCFILCHVTAECHGNRCVFTSLGIKGVKSLAHICRRGPPAPRTLCGRSSGLRWKGLFDGAVPAMCACVIQPSPFAAAHAAGAAGGTCLYCCFNATLISVCHKLNRHLCVIYKSAVMTS